MKALTGAQEKFAVAIATGALQREAYFEAYPRSRKWKPASVDQSASKLLAQPRVAARVQVLRNAAAHASVLEHAEVLNEIRLIALSDIAGIMNADGTVKRPDELEPALRAAVASFEVRPDGTIRYRFWDKNSALEKAARHLGLYEKDNRQRADALSTLLEGLTGNVTGVADDA